LGLHAWQPAFDFIDHRHGIGVGLAIHLQDNGRFTVDRAERLGVFHAVVDFGHIGKAHGLAVLHRHDQRAEGLRVFQLFVGADNQHLTTAFQRADRRVGVGVFQDGGEFGGGKIARGEFFGINFDAHRKAFLALYCDLRHAIQG